jgi:hypothetical protein
MIVGVPPEIRTGHLPNKIKSIIVFIIPFGHRGHGSLALEDTESRRYIWKRHVLRMEYINTRNIGWEKKGKEIF